MNKKLFALFFLAFAHVSGQSCETRKNYDFHEHANVTTVTCTQNESDFGMKLLEYAHRENNQMIQFFKPKLCSNGRCVDRCTMSDERPLADFSIVEKELKFFDRNKVTEVEFRDFQVKLPGDLIKYFPNVKTLHLIHTDPEYERYVNI